MTRQARQLLAAVMITGIAGGGTMIFSALSATASGFSGPFTGPHKASASEVLPIVQEAGALANPTEDLWANAINLQNVNPADGGSGGTFLRVQRDGCMFIGEGRNDSICTANGTITVGTAISFPTTTVQALACPQGSSCYVISGSPNTGQFFRIFPTTDTTGCATGTAGGVRFLSTPTGWQALAVCADGTLRRLSVDTPTTLPTCAAALEGLSLVDAASGGTSGSRTRRCLCTSDGAGTPAYAWQNLITGTVDTSTTCAP